jgi:non-specific serine/threonine protein kinase
VNKTDSPMRVLKDVAAALQAGALPAEEVLDSLAARAGQSEAANGEELAAVAQWVAEGSLAEPLGSLLMARLRALQAVVAANVDGDATVARPQRQAGVSRPDPDADPDVTKVHSSRGRRLEVRDDITLVQPASLPLVRTATEPAAAVRATTLQVDSLAAESWKKVAEAESGDYVTVGSVLKGRFHLEREIGRGGMGVVFLARDERKIEARDRDPYVAVKILNDEFRRHPDSLMALQRESRRSQALGHDNIVRVYDFDKDGATVFMTMEFIDGCDLKTLIRERAYNGMPLKQAWPLIEGMARALKRAHDAGVVHSDFKPGNVMVTGDGVPKVFDFGIARAGKHVGNADGEQTVFDAGTLGALTPAYASLEMIQGAEPTPSDDVYALGCVIFELLTGKHPYAKASAEVAMKEGRQPPAVPNLTRRQHQTLCDAVAFIAERRVQSAEQLLEGLRDVSLRERIGPALTYGAMIVVILAIGGFFGTRYLHTQHVDGVVSRFKQDDTTRFINEDQALNALAELDDADRQQAMLIHGDLIQSYLLGRLDTYWNPAQGRYDYASAKHLFALREPLQLYLPQLDKRRAVIDAQWSQHLLATGKKVAPPTAAADPVACVSGATAGDGHCVPSVANGGPGKSAAGDRPVTTPASAPAQATDREHLQDVALKLTREGERNFARQNYSGAIANAQAALAVKPGDTKARRLLDQAKQAQNAAMNSISIQ